MQDQEVHKIICNAFTCTPATLIKFNTYRCHKIRWTIITHVWKWKFRICRNLYLNDMTYLYLYTSLNESADLLGCQSIKNIKCNYSDMHINKTPSLQDLYGSRPPGQFIIFCNKIVIATLLCILPLVFLSLHFSLSLPLSLTDPHTIKTSAQIGD